MSAETEPLTYLCLGFVRDEDARAVLDSVRSRLSREDIPAAAISVNPAHIISFLEDVPAQSEGGEIQ